MRITVISGKDADRFSDAYPAWRRFMNELFTLISSGESWDMKFNDCTLKGLVRMQALDDLWQSFWASPPPPQKNKKNPTISL